MTKTYNDGLEDAAKACEAYAKSIPVIDEKTHVRRLSLKISAAIIRDMKQPGEPPMITEQARMKYEELNPAWKNKNAQEERGLWAAFLQGYQSALEDMRGEAVVWPNGCDETVPQALRYLAEHERPAGGNDSFNSEHLHQLADEIEELASKPLFTSPQPTQPDQWNAAIEAAAELATQEDQDWMARKILELLKEV